MWSEFNWVLSPKYCLKQKVFLLKCFWNIIYQNVLRIKVIIGVYFFHSLVSSDGFVKKRLAWVPLEDITEDRHHSIFYKCSFCSALTRACQYFGHLNEGTCSFERGLTVMDKPVCSREVCTKNEFLTPSHSLHQRFLDQNMNIFFVFFRDPKETDDFFRNFPAKDCLENDNVWCNFVSTRCWYLSKHNCNDPVFVDIVLFHDPAASKRYYYVSGALPPFSNTA